MQRATGATVEKLVASQSATACTVQGVSNFIQLQDQNSGRRFLVDTGASLSLLPHKSKNPCSGPPLVSASGSPIRSWGFQRHTVKFGPHAFTFNFLLADVAWPILSFACIALMSLLPVFCVSLPALGLESRLPPSPPLFPPL